MHWSWKFCKKSWKSHGIVMEIQFQIWVATLITLDIFVIGIRCIKILFCFALTLFWIIIYTRIFDQFFKLQYYIFNIIVCYIHFKKEIKFCIYVYLLRTLQNGYIHCTFFNFFNKNHQAQIDTVLKHLMFWQFSSGTNNSIALLIFC